MAPVLPEQPNGDGKPAPVVMLTSSGTVILLTIFRALASALAHSPTPAASGEGTTMGEVLWTSANGQRRACT